MLAAALLYVRACGILKARGRTVPRWQRACWFAGLGLILIATQTFLDPVGERALLSMHMAQHLLLADLPAPLLLIGVRAPVLYFFWPRPVLVTAARSRPLRSVWKQLRRPPVALSIWLVTLYAWHVPAAYEAALSNRLVHDLEHVTFALTGVLAWWPLLDPTHHRVEGRVWKVLYVIAARTIGGVLGVMLVAWPTQIYGSYGDAATAYGVSPLTDQQIAGAMMMFVDSVIVVVGATWFLATIGRGEEHADDLVHVAPQPERSPSLSADDRNV